MTDFTFSKIITKVPGAVWRAGFLVLFLVQSFFSFAQPANDNPCSATPINVNASCIFTTYTNVAATNNAVPGAPGCGNFVNNSRDVWFAVTVPPGGAISFDSNTGSMTDGAMAVYSGPCGALALIACDDDNSVNGLMPALTVTGQVPGSVLFVRFWGFGGNNTGTFKLCASTPLPPNAQDCPGALPICQNVLGTAISYSGTGNIPNEINPLNSCLAAGERADVWYTFTVQTSGNLNFLITPTNVSEDYDWAVYNLTTATCADIFSNPGIRVSCNYSGTGGNTGPNGGSVLNSQGGGGTPFNAVIPVLAGQTYVVNVSNFSLSQNGYTIDFGASTASIFDNVQPSLQSVNAVNCGSNQLTVIISENVLCSSISTGDFTVTGPGGPYTVTAWSGTGCNMGATYGRIITLTVSPAMSPAGNFQVCSPAGAFTDLCGNPSLASCVNFSTNNFTTIRAVSACPGYVLPWGGVGVAGANTHLYTTSSGCDSTVTINLTIKPVYNTSTNVTICANQSYVLPWGGNGVAGANTHLYTSSVGCDSTVTINLTVKPSYTNVISASTCSNQPYNLPWGGTGVAGANNHLYVAANGCDSTVTINLTINPTYTTPVNISTCSNVPYNLPWGGTGVAGPNTHLYQSVKGCDSTVTINLTIKPVFNTSTNVSSCVNIPYNLPWGGTAVAGPNVHVYVASNGCDSTVTINLTIKPTFTSSTNVSSCANVPYNLPWGGTGVAGPNVHVYVASNGCDSTVTINLTVNPVAATSTNVSTCANVPYNLPWGGTGIAGPNVHLYQTVNGCDSTVTINLTIKPIFTTSINVSSCANVPYNLPWGGTGVAGPNAHVYQTAGGCDSTVTINLTINPVASSSTNVSSCPNVPYNLPWGGTGVAGPNVHVYQTVNGCDSTVTVNLVMKPVYTSSTNVSSCANVPYNLPWGGTGVAGPNIHVYQAVNSCDSTVTINLTINTVSSSSTNVSSCANVPYNLPWGGTGTAGPNVHIYQSVSGCDSTVTINLTVKPVFTSSTNVSSCSNVPYNLPWGGTGVAGPNVHVYQTAGGCDSTVTVNLTINAVSSSSTNVSSCANVPFNLPWGGTGTAGPNVHIYQSVNGCDSTVTINLTVKPVFNTATNVSSCSNVPYNLPWGGTGVAGPNIHLYQTAGGCDSTVTINLTISAVFSSSTNVTSCSNVPYNLPWGGTGVAGPNVHVYQTVSGCDSTVTINLTVNPVANSSINISTCSNVPYILPWGGTGVAGPNVHLYQTINGCDSTVTINLTINPVSNTAINASTCVGVPYNLPWGGTGVSGPNVHLYQTSNGCDSTVTINLAINPVFNITLNANTCASVPYNLPWGGAAVAGPNAHLYQTAKGCDSTVTINLTIDPAYTTSQNASTCAGVPFNLPWGGTGVAGANAHLYHTTTGCDSTVTINLTINPVYNTPVSAATCSGVPYNLPWGGTGVAGPNVHLYQTANGCDSTVTINLTINPVYNISSNASACTGVPYNLPWGGAGIAGPNTHLYLTASGCDSSITINLAINPVYNTSTNISTCANVPYNLPWGGVGVTGPNTHLYQSINNCDSTVTINLTIDSAFTSSVNASTCSGTPYNLPWGGVGIAGANTHIYHTGSGCDSIVTINLIINPVYNIPVNASTCSGVPYNLPWGGTGVAGPNVHLYQTANGCDSTVTINLTINPVYNISSNATTCANAPFNLPWGGTGIAGANSHLYFTARGCDSTVTINLTINPDFNTSTNISTCANVPYNLPWGGAGITGPNTHLYQSVNSCDSVVTINLSIDSAFTSSMNASTCFGTPYNLPWGGTGVAGANTHLYNTGSGCDSIVTINLTINQVYNTSTAISTCANVPYNLPWGGTGVAGPNVHLYQSVGGCDSTVTINLTINPFYNTSTNISACSNHAYILPWGGTGIAGPNIHLYHTASGCDSTVTINLTIDSAYNTAISASTCTGVPYNLPWGGAGAAGPNSHQYTAVSGCDSVVTINLTITAALNTSVNASTCAGSPFNLPWGGVGVAGPNSNLYHTLSGCDSTATINLSILSAFTTTVNASTCIGTPFILPWGGTGVSGPNVHLYQTSSGCDSTVTIDLTIDSVFSTSVNASTCAGSPYNLPWGGIGIAGANSHQYSSITGCDSTVTINLTINPTSANSTNVSTCSNIPYNLPWGGIGVSGTNTHQYFTSSGCDSIVTINLTVDSVFNTSMNASTCTGSIYNLPWGGTGVAGPNSHQYISSGGCDSTATINLSFTAAFNTFVNASTCVGSPFNLPWGGVGVAGPNSNLYHTLSGCDSTATINLTIDSAFNISVNASTCANAPYNLPWGGVGVAGANSHHYITSSGCDSSVTINLTIDSAFTTSVNASTCSNSPYLLPWGGIGVAGANAHLYHTASGCDSTVTINLAINPAFNNAVNASTCTGTPYNLPWGGVGVAGANQHLYITSSGCDSLVTINLTIAASFNTSVNASACTGSPFNLPWGGVGVPGANSHLYHTSTGCDSTATINLTIDSAITTSVNASTCTGSPFNLPWGGVGVAGPNSHHYVTTSGCDSIATINLTIDSAFNTSVNASTCTGSPFNLPWGGVGVAGPNSHHYVTTSGCDSIATINLTIDSAFNTFANASTCTGSPFNLPWGGVGVAGSNSHHYITASGCDSSVTINLTIDTAISTTVNAATCTGSPFNLPWGGAGVAGPNSHHYITASGCDSTVTINLTIDSAFTTSINASTCTGTPFILPWGGSGVEGPNSHHYITASGCDSTATINLSIDSVFSTTVNASTCSNQPYILPWGGTGVAGANTHQYVSANGCDSIVTIQLRIDQVANTVVNASTCLNQNYNLPWGSVGVAGTNTHLYTGANACDSSVTINLTILPVYNIDIDELICIGNSYALPWGGSESSSGNYSHTYNSLQGCDSTVTIHLTVDPGTASTANITICAGDNYMLPEGISHNTSGTYISHIPNAAGCDSAITTNLTVETPLIVTATPGTILCFGQSTNVNVTATGGSGIYSTGTGLLPGYLAGDYTFIVTDNFGCSGTSAQISIPQPAPVVISTSTTLYSCSAGGGTATVTSATGGTGGPYSYLWLPGGQVTNPATGLDTGAYTVTVSDINGCYVTDAAVINAPPAINIAMNMVPALCHLSNNGSASAAVSGGIGPYQFAWSPSGGNGSTANNLLSGNYTVLVTDSNGCTGTSSILVTAPSALTSNTTTTSTSCFGSADGTATIYPNGGSPPYSFSWNPAGGNLDVATHLISGNYNVTVTDYNGCSLTAAAFVPEPAPVNFTVAGAALICIGQTAVVSVNATGGTLPYYYQWSNGNTTSSQVVSPAITTVYTVDVQDSNGCTSPLQSLTISVNPALAVSLTAPPVMCEGDVVNISATAAGGNGGPYSYSWNNGQIAGSLAVVSPVNDSTFTVTATDGCGTPAAKDSALIRVNPLPQVTFLPHQIQGCTPVMANFLNYSTAPLGSSFMWDFGDNTLSQTVNPSHLYTIPGQYNISLVIQTPEGCLNSLTVQHAVIVNGLPDANFHQSTDLVKILSSPIEFTDYSTDAVRWEWDFGDKTPLSYEQNPVHQYSDTGNYKIRLAIANASGCLDTTYGSLRVEDEFVIYIPNAFTPNGDGTNDGFMAFGVGFTDFDMWILDRWGKQIFHSTGKDQPWDGSYFNQNEILCQNDVYEYVIQVHDKEGKQHKFIGHVTLVR